VEAVRQLIKSAQKNDLAAFERLVILYQKRVYNLSMKLTGNSLDAQDLSQEVFVRAFRSIAAFRSEADFGTWLHRITVNIWLNSRRKQVIPTVSLDEQVDTGEGTVSREVGTLEEEPETIVMKGELSELMQKSLEHLPREQKAVLVLRELEDCSYEEIATILNCSSGTVRSRLSRAREALRRQVVERARRERVHITGVELTACTSDRNNK
jgi:RNA polymerase sigma-70 factor (ECF subfamily)